MALVAYAGSAHLVMPLTDDPTVLLPFLEALDPGIMPEAGRKASAALALAETLLDQEDAAGLGPLRHRRRRSRRHRGVSRKAAAPAPR